MAYIILTWCPLYAINKKMANRRKRFPELYTKELLEPIIKSVRSVRSVCITLGVSHHGTMHLFISNRIKELSLDTSHFLGKGHNLGNHTNFWKKRDPQEILKLRTTGFRENGYRLSRSLKEIGREYKCVKCNNLGNWMDKKLVLEVDHINNNYLDNRQENLQFLCPNCHSQKSRKNKNAAVDQFGRSHITQNDGSMSSNLIGSTKNIMVA